jgi:4-hydroxy-tetrahydrodipicolinate synthase
VDITPDMFADLADEETLVRDQGVVRRRATDHGPRQPLRRPVHAVMGMDDLVLEGVAAGVDGWVAGW